MSKVHIGTFWSHVNHDGETTKTSKLFFSRDIDNGWFLEDVWFDTESPCIEKTVLKSFTKEEFVELLRDDNMNKMWEGILSTPHRSSPQPRGEV